MQNNDIAVFYGSQSGVSERFAERLSREWQARFALRTLVADLDDYDPQSLSRFPKDGFVVFLISTYGEGDPPDNAVNFCAGLDKMRKTGVKLDSLRYLAMGMGNSNYKHYNQVITTVDSTLSELGAQRIGPVGRADEGKGTTEESFMDWKEEILLPLDTLLTLTERPIVYTPTISIHDVPLDSTTSPASPFPSPRTGPPYSPRNPYPAPLATSCLLASSADRQVLHLTFNLNSAPSLRYKTGDHLAIHPSNPTTAVTTLLSLLGLLAHASTPIIILPLPSSSVNPAPSSLPSPTTREALLTHHLDILGPVSRDLLALLAPYAPSPAAATKLTHLAADAAAFRTDVSLRHLSLGAVLASLAPEQGAWARVPFTLLADALPRLQPRRYSISSTPLLAPRTPSITVAVAAKRLACSSSSSADDDAEADVFHGLASHFLLSHHLSLLPSSPPSPSPMQPSLPTGPRFTLPTPPTVPLTTQPSGFALPPNPATPLLMIAAGTGIAPFRAFVLERVRLAELGKATGRMVLVYGCRDQGDWLYRGELGGAWQRLQELEANRKGKEAVGGLEVFVGFSRPDGGEGGGGGKRYVQHVLREHGELVAKLVVEERAAVYVCGAARMAREVREAVVGAVAERVGGAEEAEEWVGGRMRKEGRWQEDVWG